MYILTTLEFPTHYFNSDLRLGRTHLNNLEEKHYIRTKLSRSEFRPASCKHSLNRRAVSCHITIFRGSTCIRYSKIQKIWQTVKVAESELMTFCVKTLYKEAHLYLKESFLPEYHSRSPKTERLSHDLAESDTNYHSTSESIVLYCE